jgi:hypothetical protein
MWKLRLRPRYSFSGNICFKFSAFFLCSAPTDQPRSLKPTLHLLPANKSWPTNHPTISCQTIIYGPQTFNHFLSVNKPWAPTIPSFLVSRQTMAPSYPTVSCQSTNHAPQPTNHFLSANNHQTISCQPTSHGPQPANHFLSANKPWPPNHPIIFCQPTNRGPTPLQPFLVSQQTTPPQ